MRTIIYCSPQQRDLRKRKLRLKLPNYLIKRKILMIREKIIARKYGILYLQKVFGKYYPSECGRYYEKKLLRKCFDKLRSHWFEEKELYRLLYKANIFFCQKLTRKLFNEWQSYCVKSIIVKQKENIVKYDYDELRQKDILRNWNTATKYRKKFKLIRINLIELHHSIYTLLLMLKLAEYFYQEIEQDLLEIKSILCGRFFTLREYTRRWKVYILQQKNNKVLISKAENYHKSKVSLIHFSHWIKYVCFKHTKHEIVELCTGLYGDCLLKMVLQLWKNETRSKIIGRKNMLLASEAYDRSIKRKLLKTWRRYVKHKLQGRRLKHKANFFYTMRLKQKVLNVLSKHVASCKNTKLAIQKLKLFYKRLLIMTVWDKWSAMIEEINNYELRDKLLLAISFNKMNIVRKFLRKWVTFNKNQRRKKDLELKAIDICKIFYHKKYFHIWRIAYREKRRVTTMEEKALKFVNDSLIQNSMIRWIKSYNYKVSMKEKYKKSVLHYKQKIISKCFATWISFCNERIRDNNLINEASEYYSEMIQRKFFHKLSMNVAREKIEHEKIEDARNYYRNNLVIRVFKNWREYYIQAKELENKVQRFHDSRRNKLKRKITAQWRLYVHNKKCSKRKALMSATHHRKKAFLKFFEKLKNYVYYKKDKNARLAYLECEVEGIQQNLKKIYLRYWRVARFDILKEKSKIFHADEFYDSRLKHEYFRLWQKFMRQHKMKRQHQMNLNDIMNDFILKKCLRVWYIKSQALLNNHLNERWAGKIYEMKIRYKYFIGWKYYAQICIKETKEINNAKEFHEKLVIKEGLQHLIKVFLSNTELKLEKQLKNVERNSSHKFELLRKYFNKWHKYVSTKITNRSQAIKYQTDLENDTPQISKLNDKKYISELIPHFVIPEFMKNEIKLRFGIGKYSSYMPINANKTNILQTDGITKANRSFSNQKLRENVFHSRTDGNSQENVQANLENESENDNKFKSNNFMSLEQFRSNMKMMSPNKTWHTLSPDSIKSDSDSAKTYVVENPAYYQILKRKNISRNTLRSEVSDGKKT